MDVNALFARAEAAFVAGRHAAARADLLAVLRVAGEHPAVLHLLALVEKAAGDRAAAGRAFVRALKVAPNDPQINNNHANLLDATGDTDAALGAYGRAIAAAPGFADARLNRALLLQRLGRAAEALADLDATGPPTARLHAARGAVLRDLERLDEAAAAFDAALALDPARPPALAGRARVALERGEPDAAARYERALAVRPDDIELRLSHALAIEAEGGASAIPLLESILARHPGWAEGHEQLARMRSEAGDHDDPARTLRAALANAPVDAALHQAHWRILSRAERFAELRVAVTAARAHLPEDEALLLTDAVAASEAGDHADADRLFARLGTGDDLALPHARHLLRSGAPDRAAAMLEAAVARAPWDIGAWAHLSLAWRLLGDARLDWLCGQPGLVGAIDLELSAAELDELAATLRDLHRTRAHPIGQSLRGGTQTRGRLLARAEAPLVALRARFEEAVRAHAAALPAFDAAHPLLRHREARFGLAGSWSVRLGNSGYHVHHIHPRGVFSSAFYVSLPEAMGGDARAGWLDLGAPPVELGLTLPAITSIEPRPGRLALFPSYLFHGTRPFASGERLTVAFDVEPS